MQEHNERDNVSGASVEISGKYVVGVLVYIAFVFSKLIKVNKRLGKGGVYTVFV